jgi:nucleotide-binding universal stress UspA family protein
VTQETIVVGTDFGDEGRAAVDWAVELARGLGARVVVGHSFDLPLYGFPDASLIVTAKTAAQLSTDAQTQLDAELARVGGRGVPIEGQLTQGDPRDALPELATRAGATLLVVGSHGRRGLTRALLGSVAEGIVRSSRVPVVVVRGRVSSDASASTSAHPR